MGIPNFRKKKSSPKLRSYTLYLTSVNSREGVIPLIIALRRACVGLGLKEAKDIVDAVRYNDGVKVKIMRGTLVQVKEVEKILAEVQGVKTKRSS